MFEELKKYKVKFIIGNHDYYLIHGVPTNRSQVIKDSVKYTKNKILKENLLKIRNVKSYDDLFIDGLRIKMYHGSPWDTVEEGIYPDYYHLEKFEDIEADIIILGHTHRPMIKGVGKLLVINPGSCGQPRDDDKRASFGMFDTNNKKFVIERVEYDVDQVCKKAIKEGLDYKLIKILKPPRPKYHLS